MVRRFIATSVSRGLIARFQVTHERRRIAVFSGPPGVGKTTAIDEWRSKHPAEVVVVKLGRQDAREGLVLRHMLEALTMMKGEAHTGFASGLWELRRKLYVALCDRAGLDFQAARQNRCPPEKIPLLTIVFDEAQNLSRQAIEALRYWNDDDRCSGPFPVGMVFVGNSEFSLATSHNTPSVISAAVADRALYVQTVGYEELSDDDLSAVIRANGIDDPSAAAALVRCFSAPRSVRSLRRVLDLVEELREAADGGVVTAQTIGMVLIPR